MLKLATIVAIGIVGVIGVELIVLAFKFIVREISNQNESHEQRTD